MSTQVVSQASTPHRGRQSVALVLLATLVALGIAVTAVIALTSGGASGGGAIAAQREAFSVQPSPECGVDLEYLAAEIGTMPEQVRVGVLDGLSPQMRRFVDTAISDQSSESLGSLRYGYRYNPPVPDGPTLARVLASIPAADARAIRSGLSPEIRAAITASSAAASPAGPTCP